VEEGSFLRIQKVKQRDHIVGKSLNTMKNLNERAKKQRLDNYLDVENKFPKERVRKECRYNSPSCHYCLLIALGYRDMSYRQIHNLK
jgi:hypothetical protein